MRLTARGAVVGLLAIAAVLLCWRLDNGYLWQDEAETAVLARHALQFGYPRATNGRSILEVPARYATHAGDAWVYSPWAPFYLLAGVFAIAGESTTTARLPFAVFGWLSIVLAWRLARQLGASARVQVLTVALLTFSVPFLLHMRQCRYYSLMTAEFLAICLIYVRWMAHPSNGRTVALALLFALLFHTNFGTFVPAVAAVGLHQALQSQAASRRALWWGGALTALLTVPWAVMFSQPSTFIGAWTPGRMAQHAQYYIRVTNKFLLPLAAMLVTGAWLWWRGRRARARVSLSPAGRFLLGMVAAQMLFLLLPDQRHMRYLMPVVPLFAIATAYWLAACYRVQPLLGSALMALAVFTNVLQSPRRLVPLLDFAGELTHAYRGPMEGVVEHLQAHARPTDIVKIPYDDRTLMFYTRLQVEPPSQFLQESYPEWVILRRDWIPGEFFTSPYFHRLAQTYDRIELDAPDILWQNREDPGSHHFQTVTDAPRVVMYHRRAAAAGG